MKQFFVYGLYDPAKPDVIRYVGAASNIGRPLEHRKEADRHPERRTHKLAWIRSIKVVEWLILRECKSWDQTLIAEKSIIASLRASGVDLTNGTGGGEGVFNPTKKVREKCSAALRRVLGRPEHRRRHSAIMKAIRARPEVKAKYTATLGSPEYRKKRSALAKASNSRPEVRRRIGAANKIAWTKPGRRSRHSAALRASWARRKWSK